jgi:hypothetical protein
MKLIDGIPIWGTPDEGAVSQIKTCAKTADRVALMADHHKGYASREVTMKVHSSLVRRISDRPRYTCCFVSILRRQASIHPEGLGQPAYRVR